MPEITDNLVDELIPEQIKMKDGSTPFTVSSDIRSKRLNICRECDRLFRPTYTCKECGCFMAVKTWIDFVDCPLQKW